MAGLLMFGSGQAAATTYVASRAVGTSFLDISITTDGVLGVLAASNILDWSLALTDGVKTFTLEGPGGLDNSQARIFGNQVTATASDLLFNFNFDPGRDFSGLIIQQPRPDAIDGLGGPFWCVAFGGCSEPISESLSTDFVTFPFAVRTGQFVIGSVADTSGAPEPATWALMISGFGLAGAALRRGRKAAVA